MQNYDIQCFLNIGNSQFECAFLPLGIGELAMEWRFSEQFPIGFNSSISTQSLKFIKSDRAFLLNEYLRTGEATEIYLIVRIKGNDFRMILDFAAAQWNDEYFECGAKGTPLQDILDNIAREKKKLTFDNASYKTLVNNTRIKLDGKSSTEKLVNINYDTVGTNSTETTFDNINELNCSSVPTYGFKINMPIQPLPISYTDSSPGYNMMNFALFPENFTSLFSCRIRDASGVKNKRIKSDILTSCKLKNPRGMATQDTVDIVLTFSRCEYRDDGTKFNNLLWIQKESINLGLPYNDWERHFHFSQSVNMNYEYPAGVVDMYYHLYFTIIWKTGYQGMSAAHQDLLKFSIDNFEVDTNLTGISNYSLRGIMLKDYLDKLNESHDIFNTNTLTNDMLKCMLTTRNFGVKQSSNQYYFYVDINELLQSLSILYGVAVVEKNGKYEFIKLNNLSGIRYRLFDKNTTINYTNSTNYDKLEIGTERGEIKYAADIFGKKVYSQINNRIINTLEITPKLLHSGEKIFELFVKGESNDDVMMLHTLDYYTIINNQYESPAQFINEYYSNIAVLRRLSPFLSSYFARKASNLSGEAGNAVLTQINHNGYAVQDNGIVSFTTEALGTDYQIFEHYNANFSVPFTTETLLEYILSCKLLKINNNLYLPIKIDVNFEANTIEVECKIFKQ